VKRAQDHSGQKKDLTGHVKQFFDECGNCAFSAKNLRRATAVLLLKQQHIAASERWERNAGKASGVRKPRRQRRAGKGARSIIAQVQLSDAACATRPFSD
jgi:hypothetical protein